MKKSKVEEGITKMNYEVISLIGKPEIKEQAAQWFHEKWGIPLGVYTESIGVATNSSL